MEEGTRVDHMVVDTVQVVAAVVEAVAAVMVVVAAVEEDGADTK